MSKINDKLRKFISNNLELVEEYEQIETSVPLEYCVEDIEAGYQTYLKINKNNTFDQVLKKVLLETIKYNTTILEGFDAIIKKPDIDTGSDNTTLLYFKEINNIYTKHKNNYDIEYCPENRDKLIEMNLKTVISIAKKYQGLGLTLLELISAGNLGLVIAWDKFDPSRCKLKDNILNSIQKLPYDEIEYSELILAVEEYLKYGDIQKKFLEAFHEKNTYTKKYITKWVNNNIRNAKFNSIAVLWIRAHILIEIDNNSRVVKKPKSEIYRDREKFGAYKKEITVDIDDTISEDSDTAISDVLCMEDEANTDLDVSEAYDTFKGGLNKLLDGVKTRDRSIFLKKFGIGLPRPMLPKEIAEQEGLSIARISQIFQSVIEQMRENLVKYNIKSNALFDAVRKIQ